MKRFRKQKDGTITLFTETIYPGSGPYRAEIQVTSLTELRKLKRDGKLIRLRMTGTPSGGTSQDNLVPWEQIEDFDWSK